MVTEQEDVFYYITAMNEKYEHPAMPEGCEDAILKGMYLFDSVKGSADKKIQLLGSGTILREVIAAAKLLKNDFNVSSDIWSATSMNELRRDALEVERHNRLNPTVEPQESYVTKCLGTVPVLAATDYIRTYAEQIAPFVKGDYTVLGTDGFGRSDTREKLREFFEVDRQHIAYSAVYALAKQGVLTTGDVLEAIKKYNIDPQKSNPVLV
jgi:pyruvate dehydrogenase E1 component